MSWKTLIDNTLEKVFHAKPDNAEKVAQKRRDGLLAGIDAAIAALKQGAEKGPRGWYTTKGNVVKAALRSSTRTVKLEGQDAVYVPKERAVDFYTHLRKDVAAKSIDGAILAAWAGEAAAPEKKTRAKRGPMSPEKLAARNAKRAATLAAKSAK